MSGPLARFATPPLTEALIGFTFGQSEPADLTLFGSLFGKIQADFPDKEREVRSALDPASEAPEVMRFFSADRSSLVRAGEDSLSVHHVKRHPGWNELRLFASRQLETYRSIMQPEQVEAATVRYVNRVNLPGPQAAFSDYVRLALPWSGDVVEGDEPFRDLYIQAVLPYPSDAVDLAVYLAHVPAQPDEKVAYVLDLIASATHPLAFEEVDPWLDRAHGRIETFFEHAFTDKARSELFHEVRPT